MIWAISFRLLLPRWPYSWQWLIFSGLSLAYCLWVLWHNLRHNFRTGESIVLPRLGLGNRLSLLRGLFISLLAGFLFAPWPQGALAWTIALLYTAASIADGLDGFAARKANQVTLLGQHLDMTFDGLGVAVVVFLAVGYGQLPFWFLGIGLARYFFLLGLWWRERLMRPIYELPPSDHRRIMAGMLMGMMTVVLWPIVPPSMTHVAAVIIGIPILLGFTRDWLMASGRLQATNPTYLRVQRTLYILMAKWLPPIWRVLLTLAMGSILTAVSPLLQPQSWLELLLSWQMPAAPVWASLLSLVAIGGALLVFLGIAGRIAAILLLFPIGFDITTRGLAWNNTLALICALSICLLGSGLFSLWQPEEAF